MVKSVLMKTEERPRDKKKRIFINFLLGLWMSAILALQLLLYPPQPLLTLVEKLDMLETFYSLQELITPFFRTTDLNIDFMKKF